MLTVLTAWGYKLSLLELLAFITSVIGVGLGIWGPRSTWSWWNISSLLYAALFYQEKYYASAFLQFIFIAGGFWGWFGWGKTGAIPEKLTKRHKAFWSLAFVIGWFSLYPILKKIGAAASLTDAFGFVVDAVYTYQFWHGGSYLTAILYFIFVLIAVAGWKRWLRESTKR